VNKADLNQDMTEQIAAVAEQVGAAFLGTIPYDKAFTGAQIQRKTLLEFSDTETAGTVKSIFEKITDDIAGRGNPPRAARVR